MKIAVVGASGRLGQCSFFFFSFLTPYTEWVMWDQSVNFLEFGTRERLSFLIGEMLSKKFTSPHTMILENLLRRSHATLKLCKICVAGDAVSVKDMAELIEKIHNKKVTVERRGSLNDCLDTIDKLRTSGAPRYSWLGLQFQWVVMSGAGELKKLQNEKFPYVKATTMKQFIEQHPEFF